MDDAVVAGATDDSRLSAEQSALVQSLADSVRLALIVGPAGTGKTVALAAAHRAWQAAGVDVQGTALAAITARRLTDATGIPACSLARLLADADQPDPSTGQPRRLHPAGVVVVDEAGIVDTRRLCALFTQLAQSPSTLRLTDNRRQHDPWERDALDRLRAGNIDPAIDADSAHGRIHQNEDPEALRAELVSDYLHARAEAENQYGVAILAVSRADVAQLNALVRAALIARGELGPTPLHLRADDTADFVAGDDSMRMRTGDLVIIGRNDNRARPLQRHPRRRQRHRYRSGSPTLHTDDDRHVTLTATWAAHHDLSPAYAMTLHKAQGLTVDHALLYGSEALTREAGYVGLSRGRRENHTYLSATTRTPRA